MFPFELYVHDLHGAFRTRCIQGIEAYPHAAEYGSDVVHILH